MTGVSSNPYRTPVRTMDKTQYYARLREVTVSNFAEMTKNDLLSEVYDLVWYAGWYAAMDNMNERY